MAKNFYAEVHCMKYRIRWENKNVDDMGTLIISSDGDGFLFASI